MLGFNKLNYYKGHKDFTHHYTYKGEKKVRVYHVYKDGTIMAKGSRRPMKRIIRETEQANGKTYTQIQIRLPGKFYNWERVVAAAWFEHFDITDRDQIIRHRNGNTYDMRPINLYVTSMKQEMSKRKVLTPEQVESILFIREKENMSIRKLAKLFGVDKKTIMKVVHGKY